MEEVLKIGLISGIACKDGRHFTELICRDADGRPVEILVPTSDICDEMTCDFCEKKESCDITAALEIQLGRSVIIHRENPVAAPGNG